MDSLDSFAHPQAIAAAFAMVDLSIAWVIAMVGVTTLLDRHGRETAAASGPQQGTVSRKRRFA